MIIKKTIVRRCVFITLLLLFPFSISTIARVDKKCKIINVEKYINNIKTFQLSEIADHIEYIPLSIAHLSQTKKIQEIFIDDKYILVTDRNSCILFDHTGKIIKNIERKNCDPKLHYIKNISIFHNEIIFQSNQSLYFYDLNGNFLQKLYLTQLCSRYSSIRKWLPLKKNVFLGYVPNTTGNITEKLIVFNRLREKVKSYPNYIFYDRSEALESSKNNADMYYFNGLPSCKEVLNDTLFRIINDKLEPIYHFKLGKYSYPINDQKLPYKDLVQNWSNYIFINKVFETKNHFFVECDLGKYTPNNIAQLHQPVLGVYTKIDNQFFFIKAQDKDSVNPESIYNNVDAGPSFFPMVSVNDSTLAMWIDAHQLKAHIASEDFKNSNPTCPKKKEKLVDLTNKLNENDNLILMIVKLKE